MRKSIFVFAVPLFLIGGAGCGGGGGGSSAVNNLIAPPAIVTASPLPAATVSTPYSVTLTATGGVSPFAWTLSGGTSLPTGLSLDLLSGEVHGTPTTAGTVTFTARVTDTLVHSATKDFSITVNALTPPTITTASPLVNGFVGEAYSVTFTATGTGTGPFTWSYATGASLTSSVATLNASTGTLTGTPSVSGDFPFTVQVTDGNALSTTKSMTVHIFAGGTIYARSMDFSDFTGSPSPITFRVQPAVTAANSVSPTGRISGLGTGQRVSESAQMFVDEAVDRLWFVSDARPAVGTFTASPAGVFVWSNASTIDGSVATGAQVFFDNEDELGSPSSVAVDTTNEIVYVNDLSGTLSSLRVYSGFDPRGSIPAGLTATAVLSGPLSDFHQSNINLFLDTMNDTLYIADFGIVAARTASIKAFNNMSSHVNAGAFDIAPDRTIGGATTTIDTPLTVTVDLGRNIMYVADAGGNFGGQPQILIYENATSVNGDVAPSRRIIAPASGTDNTHLGLAQNAIDIALYPERDELYVVNPAESSIMVFSNISSANGNVAPSRIITSPQFSAAPAGSMIGIALDRNH